MLKNAFHNSTTNGVGAVLLKESENKNVSGSSQKLKYRVHSIKEIFKS